MDRPRSTSRAPSCAFSGLGCLLGILAALGLAVFVGMPMALAHHNDLPLERLYGDLAVELAVRTQAGNATNPFQGDSRRVEAGRLAYTGSCAVCHGVAGDGQGVFGTSLYPPATDLQAHDTQGKSDAQLFWIIKNGLSFAGMPGFGSQYSDQEIWSLVSYTRSLGNPNRTAAPTVPTPTAEQLAIADPAGDPVHRGAAVYFAQGCHTCHGAVGDAPGQLGLRGGGREANQAIRQGRAGMPVYTTDQVSDAQLADLVAYMNTFARGRGR